MEICLLDKILDVAGQKGTGKWTGISALDLGIPVTLIAEAVFARCLSSLKEERIQASVLYGAPKNPLKVKDEFFVDKVRDALYAAKIVSYAQGFMLMRAAATEMKWNLNFGNIALLWRGGCIIRSRFLGDIQKAYAENPNLPSLALSSVFPSRKSAGARKDGEMLWLLRSNRGFQCRRLLQVLLS